MMHYRVVSLVERRLWAENVDQSTTNNPESPTPRCELNQFEVLGNDTLVELHICKCKNPI